MIEISVQDVHKSFGEEEVLKGISREFEAGKIHGIVGNNGSGKTVLMKCICGFLFPSSGRILVRGKQVGKDMDYPENMGIIIETPGFLPNLTGLKNLKLLANLNRKINEQDIRHAIKRVGLDPDLKKPVGKYSLGMRQRLGIAQAIMEDPSLLILDEPLNGLDKNGARHMRQLIKELRTEGKTILLASHNQIDIDELCDTVCEMDNGIMTMIRDDGRKQSQTAAVSAPDENRFSAENLSSENLTAENPAAENEPGNSSSRLLLANLTLLENAALPLTARGIPKKEREQKAAAILNILGVGKVLHAYPSQVTDWQREQVIKTQKMLLLNLMNGEESL